MSYNIAVLFSGNGSTLQALIDNQFHYNISLALASNGNAYGIQRSAEAGLNTTCCGQKRDETRDEYGDRLANKIDQVNPNLIVLAGFMKILSPGFCQRFAGRCINVHPSLLPNYKGLHTHQRVLDANEDQHGMSIHWVTEELDGGKVIVQKSFNITPSDTAETLKTKVKKMEQTWLPWMVNQLARGLDPYSK